MKPKIIDNFLDKEHWNTIQECITSNAFTWTFVDTLNYAQTNDDAYFAHIFYLPTKHHLSPYYDVIKPIMNKIPHDGILRIKANMYMREKTVREHASHIDYDASHLGAIYSINTCNGYTRIGDTKVESVANRIVFLDPSQRHASTGCTDQRRRLNINLNLIQLNRALIENDITHR